MDRYDLGIQKLNEACIEADFDMFEALNEEYYEEAYDEYDYLLEEEDNAPAEEKKGIMASVGGAIKKIYDGIAKRVSAFMEFMRGTWNIFVDKCRKVAMPKVKQVGGKLKSAGGTFVNKVKELFGKCKGLVQKAASGAVDLMKKLGQKIVEVINAAKDMFTKAKNSVASFAKDPKGAINKVRDAGKKEEK